MRRVPEDVKATMTVHPARTKTVGVADSASHDCDFCRELSGDPESYFLRRYHAYTRSRVIARTRHFAAFPTLGQLFLGSLLVVPLAHNETCAELSAEHREELVQFTSVLSERLKPWGEPVFFEHGAAAMTGAGCGLYHAHLHIVPVPDALPPEELFPEATGILPSLSSALKTLANSPHYLLMGNADRVAIRDISVGIEHFPSQFFRRRLAERFSIPKPWDWRQFGTPEDDLLETLRKMQSTYVSERTSDL